MSRPLSRALLALTAALSLAVLTACGGSPEAGQVLSETFSGTKKIKSGNLSVDLQISARNSTTLSQPVSLKLTGPFATVAPRRLPRFDFTLSLNGNGQTLSGGAISTGDKGYLRFQGSAYALTDAIFNQFRTGFEQAQGQTQPNAPAGLKLDPQSWVREPRNIGDADVAGTSTRHVRGSVDVPKLLDDVDRVLKQAGAQGSLKDAGLPGGLSADQRKQIQDGVKGATFDVYSGKDDKTLRRMDVLIDFAAPGSTSSSAPQTGQVRFSVQIAGLNTPQSIVAPADPKPLSELQGALRSLGALGGGTSGSGSGTGSGSGAQAPAAGDAKKLQAYTDCLQKAGRDTAKAQSCAALLNP